MPLQLFTNYAAGGFSNSSGGSAPSDTLRAHLGRKLLRRAGALQHSEFEGLVLGIAQACLLGLPVALHGCLYGSLLPGGAFPHRWWRLGPVSTGRHDQEKSWPQTCSKVSGGLG